ncbi:Type 1 glutamine amidotransferase-like domain-containing protein [Peribacillus acanthi]|uniref:Type 1 glutamine amidotransferase-like domain-containing protein n=1 Tax=Peribacillus acanthi TaxID=2171554 RepID=UPI000D3E0550|nr:Type 1 glutamine amidotransferase-like domain-containing protein [Peribacillus acanthi]
MAKLFFYSDQIIQENRRIDERLIAALPKGQASKIGYIPATGDPDKTYFNKQKSYYQQYGLKDFYLFDLEEENSTSQVEELLSCDAIHLSGGNPIYLRNNLEKHHFFPTLQKYVLDGGILIGVSGGAVQFGHNAGLFQLFISNMEETLQNLSDLYTLSIAPFEFLPHFNRWDPVFIENVLRYSKITGASILACNDGDGIIIESNNLEIIGDVLLIKNGEIKTTLSNNLTTIQ